MSRLIDHGSNKRTKPMRILCMGVGRTGTHSLHIALRKLGYNPYHGGVECFKDPPRDFNLWIEAMKCNFFNSDHKTARYGRKEFDCLMGSFDACMDFPACLFWEDLHQAYPEAKIILTFRDVDPWLKSMNATLLKFSKSPFFSIWRYMDSRTVGPLYTKLDLVWKIFCGGCFDEEVLRQAYLDHYERIRKAIPKEKLLEFHVGEGGDGWEKLCQFLDAPVPDEPWPRAYVREEFQQDLNMAYKQAFQTILQWVVMGIAVVVVGLLLRHYSGSHHYTQDESDKCTEI